MWLSPPLPNNDQEFDKDERACVGVKTYYDGNAPSEQREDAAHTDTWPRRQRTNRAQSV